IDYTGDEQADDTAVTEPTGGGFLADLRDRIHEAGSKSVRFRAGVPASTESGFVYGEWTTFAFEYQLDPITPSITPLPSLPPLDVTVNPPSPPPYAEYYAALIPLSYNDPYGTLVLGDLAGGQFTLFSRRLQQHALGNVSTVVTINESYTDSYPDSEPDGGTLSVTT